MAKIVVLPGDGIGPEVVNQALKVLAKIGEKYKFDYNLEFGKIGGSAVDAAGEPFPQETQETVLKSEAVLLGAVGGPKWDNLPREKRPEKGLLELRKTLGLFANLRPVKCWPQLVEQSPFKEEIIKNVDLLMVRELIGGAYFGKKGHKEENDELKAFDTIEYSQQEISRIVQTAFQLAEKRRKHVTSVDKANVLETSRLWRRIVEEEALKYPEVSLNHLYVDNCAMQLCLNPGQFDVIVTENMFGDILSDESSILGASLGMLPSASLGEGPGLYEPAHGSAPDIAGQNKANPLAAILSLAMMMRFSFDRQDIADSVEQAVERVLAAGLRTGDIWSEGTRLVGTEEIGDAVINEMG